MAPHRRKRLRRPRAQPVQTLAQAPLYALPCMAAIQPPPRARRPACSRSGKPSAFQQIPAGNTTTHTGILRISARWVRRVRAMAGAGAWASMAGGCATFYRAAEALPPPRASGGCAAARTCLGDDGCEKQAYFSFF